MDRLTPEEINFLQALDEETKLLLIKDIAELLFANEWKEGAYHKHSDYQPK
ncbi:hypothetical protein [Streptococcus orisratti]|uniref:hypothetical protein n=1 Tax=Streptococcus orisratti TaxID=114652 RepID=UPI003D0895E3